MKARFNISGMSCAACAAKVEKCVKETAGVYSASVNLLTNSMIVEYKDKDVEKEILLSVKNAGYGAEKVGDKKEVNVRENDDRKKTAIRLIVSVIFFVPLITISMGHMFFKTNPPALYEVKNAGVFALLQFVLVLPILFANQKYFINGYKALFKRSPNMDSLVAIGATAAVAYGIFALFEIIVSMANGDVAKIEKFSHDLYFESAGSILTLITLGKFLETHAKAKTSESISKLMNLVPHTVNVIRDDKEIEIPAEELATGDIFVLKPGEIAPADGEIIDGETAFDESAITGESVPVDKSIGSKIISATINLSGYVKVKATKVGENSTIAQIIKLVEEASSSKAPIAKLADKVSGVFVPIVMGISVIVFISWLIAGYGMEFSLTRAITVLVISCPCALGLATPVAIMTGTLRGAENGILVKSGEGLQSLAAVNAVVFDKTGTLTEGKPEVCGINAYGTDENSVIYYASALEKFSEHPLSKAIMNECEKRGINAEDGKEFKAVFGKGIQGVVGGEECFVGSLSSTEEMCTEEIKKAAEEFAHKGATPLIVCKNNTAIGIIAVADKIREESAEAVRRLKEGGIKTVMLTGDNEICAQSVADKIGIEQIYAGVMPQDKGHIIMRLKEKYKVAMVGDGINDAPALASADVGIAIGAGTDIAIESADIVLMESDPRAVAKSILLGRRVIRNIKQNLFWAFFYNGIGIPLAAGVLYPLLRLTLNPMIGAAAMSLSSVCVVCNALRIKGLKLDKKLNDKRNEIKETESMEERFTVEGMMCGHCAERVKEALLSIKGVTGAEVNLEEKTAVAVLNKAISRDKLIKAIKSAGYEAK